MTCTTTLSILTHSPPTTYNVIVWISKLNWDSNYVITVSLKSKYWSCNSPWSWVDTSSVTTSSHWKVCWNAPTFKWLYPLSSSVCYSYIWAFIKCVEKCMLTKTPMLKSVHMNDTLEIVDCDEQPCWHTRCPISPIKLPLSITDWLPKLRRQDMWKNISI